MRAREFIIEADSYQAPEIEKGDEVKVGKFKNRKATVKSITKDKNNQPVLKTNKGEHKLFKPRIDKLEEERTTKWATGQKIVKTERGLRLKFKGLAQLVGPGDHVELTDFAVKPADNYNHQYGEIVQIFNNGKVKVEMYGTDKERYANVPVTSLLWPLN